MPRAHSLSHFALIVMCYFPPTYMLSICFRFLGLKVSTLFRRKTIYRWIRNDKSVAGQTSPGDLLSHCACQTAYGCYFECRVELKALFILRSEVLKNLSEKYFLDLDHIRRLICSSTFPNYYGRNNQLLWNSMKNEFWWNGLAPFPDVFFRG